MWSDDRYQNLSNKKATGEPWFAYERKVSLYLEDSCEMTMLDRKSAGHKYERQGGKVLRCSYFIILTTPAHTMTDRIEIYCCRNGVKYLI